MLHKTKKGSIRPKSIKPLSSLNYNPSSNTDKKSSSFNLSGKLSLGVSSVIYQETYKALKYKLIKCQV